MSPRTKWLIFAAVAAGLVLWWVVRPPPAVSVEVGEVERGTIEVTVTEDGLTRPRERFVVAASITGRLARSPLTEGAAVEAGDILTSIAPPELDPALAASLRAEVLAAEARLAEAEAAVAESASAYEQAVRELERRRPLFDSGALSRETIERFEAAVAASTAALERARATERAAAAAVQAAESRLLGVQSEPGAQVPLELVRSPVRGVVLRVLEENARVVQAGTPLFEIGTEEGLEVVVDVLTEDAVGIQPGQLARISGWGGTEVLSGEVRQVEPAAFTRISALGVEEQRVNVLIDLHAPPPSLGAGYRVEAEIVIDSGSDVLSAHASALFQAGVGWAAFVAVDGQALVRPVQIGRRGAERVEVLGGLEAGDLVVLFPSDEVGEGTRIEMGAGPGVGAQLGPQ